MFGFRFEKKPRVIKDGTPVWWHGFHIVFKLIEKKNVCDDISEMERKAIRPLGAQGSSRIEIGISPLEYCGSTDSFLIKGVSVKRYSRVLIILEKLRAICQQHENYPLGTKKKRSRDFYDISQLLDKTTSRREVSTLFNESLKHIQQVFKAKEVPLSILGLIFLPKASDHCWCH